MTLERLAEAMQEGFTAIRSEMDAFRAEVAAEFKSVRAEMEVGFADVRGEMKAGFAGIRAEMATKTDLYDLRDEMIAKIGDTKEELLEEIGKIKYAREIDDLRGRVVRVEQKVGMVRRAKPSVKSS